ncbi:MAG TPA: alpha/beta fold hydrolase [Bacteroidota bacterium]|nr:alpha/beta fold hydrolase [Bacteroidota bacterium]
MPFPEIPLSTGDALREFPFSIRNSSGELIAGDLRYAEGTRGAPLVIVCHGFTAHKDWGPFPYFGRKLASLGFASVVFNFSHNGVGPGSARFNELEKFSRNTVGKELEDVRALVDAAAEGAFGGGVIDPARIGLVGHSRGGGVAILSAAGDPRVRGVAAWSTVATFLRYTPHQKEAWERDGFLPVTVRGMKTRLRFGIEVLRDLEAHREAYDLHRAVRSLAVPLLLVHGSADVSVRPAEPESLYAEADHGKTELVIIEGTGHAFGAKHPYRQGSPAIDNLVELTARWFHMFI